MAMEARMMDRGVALERGVEVGVGMPQWAPEPAAQALDLLGEAVLVLDTEGQLLGANETARELLAAGDVLVLGCDGIRARHPEQSRLLRQLIEAAGRAGRPSRQRAGWRLTLGRRGCSQELEAIVARLDSGRVALFVSDPAGSASPPPQRLCRLYGLTPTEAVVASRLCGGDRVSDIATELGVAVNTVRGHLKQVFSKTGVHRQAELVSRLLGGAARLRL